MPGRPSDSPLQYLIGLAVAVVALVGTTVFGWEFGASSGPLPIAIGVACAALAVFVWRRQ